MEDIELARMIATNSSDIPGTINRLCNEVEALRASSGDTYHNNAMRTAAGPEVFHRAMVPEIGLHLNDRRRDCGQEAIRAAIADFIYAGRVLSAMKATLFYGKDYQAPDPHISNELVGDDFHTDHFDNYQMLHAILGIASEAGELLEDVVQLVSLPDPSDCDEQDVPKLEDYKRKLALNMARETGDIDWFQELFAHTIGTTIDDCRAANIQRLRARFPDRFNSADAIARADEGEA